MKKDNVIVQKDDLVLRKQAKIIPKSEITSDKIQNIIIDMKAILATQKDGVAMAAPQIGKSIRMFIVSDSILKEAVKGYKSIGKDLVFINPEIIKLSKKKEETEEGCLSVRYKYGKVKRAIKATIKAFDENGNLMERGASGLLAQVFQHEVDHLNGILFIDKAYDIKDMPLEDIKK